MTESTLMGVDIGTSSTKTVVIGLDGALLGMAAREYPVETPRQGWAEQNPETWVSAALDTLRRALAAASISAHQVQAIGLSGQMHGTVCLDAHGRVLRPAIIWADQRSAAQVAEIAAQIGRERLAAWTANPLATGFMLATWLWLREHEPDVVAATAHLLLPKDYVRYRFTGEIGTEPSDASSTLLFDTAHRCWSAPLLDGLGLDGGVLPPVAASAAVAGGLLPEIAAATGLRPGTPVIYGGSDQAMQAVGHGVVAPGVVSSTIGTGGQLFAPIARPAYDPQARLHCFCHVLPAMWHLESAMLAAGLALQWLRDKVMPDLSYQDLADAAATVAPGAEGLFFQPYLAGERTPHMDPHARGSFVGLTLRHGREHMARAVMEGVVFGMRQGLELMLDLGVTPERIIASGGAIQHPLWRQLQADMFNRPLYQTRTVEASAVGAALLAGVGTGLYVDVADAVAQAVHYAAEVVTPDPENVACYAALADTFAALYPALRPTCHALWL
ncbi:MAG TPA: xylulokinase [Anaerolineae bacterium]|nr:xylulokinase [Anaerolineae bacterium]HQH37210.1 xylulokinase [Anaerolineae bacterium]